MTEFTRGDFSPNASQRVPPSLHKENTFSDALTAFAMPSLHKEHAFSDALTTPASPLNQKSCSGEASTIFRSHLRSVQRKRLVSLCSEGFQVNAIFKCFIPLCMEGNKEVLMATQAKQNPHAVKAWGFKYSI